MSNEPEKAPEEDIGTQLCICGHTRDQHEYDDVVKMEMCRREGCDCFDFDRDDYLDPEPERPVVGPPMDAPSFVAAQRAKREK